MVKYIIIHHYFNNIAMLIFITCQYDNIKRSRLTILPSRLHLLPVAISISFHGLNLTFKLSGGIMFVLVKGLKKVISKKKDY